MLAKVAEGYAGQHDVVVIERAPCAVLADREALEQALAHIVQNAVEASPEGTAVFLDVIEEETAAVLATHPAGFSTTREDLIDDLLP